MGRDERRSERVGAQEKVSLEGGIEGLTRDVSASGVYFTVDEKLEVGQVIRFSMEFATPRESREILRLECVGKVVRIERGGSKSGVAVAISESRLERVPRS